MPAPEAQRAVEEMARQIADLDVATSARMIQEYGSTYQSLQRDLNKLLRDAQRRGLKPWEVMRMQRLRQLEGQFMANVTNFSTVAGNSITAAQRAAVGLAANGTPMIANAALPSGISLNTLAQVGLGWNELPAEAFNAFVGISGEGKPIGNLLAPLGQDAAGKIKATLRAGIMQGKAPGVVAREIRQVAGMPLGRALTISRTEINRAHREATRLNYYANRNIVKGWRRLATKDASTCIACIALDGTLYENEEPIDSHPNCRCAMVPETLQYSDLGLDIPDDEQPPDATAWFNEQSPATQQKMLGKVKYNALQQGKVKSLKEFVAVTDDPVWGKTALVASDKSLGLEKVGAR